MTITQKILAAHAGIEKVKTGDLINAKLDRVLGNDVTTPVAINEYEKAGFDDVYDKEKICIVLDHFTPNKDIKSAAQCKKCREFAVGHEIANFFDSGEVGVEHALLPEKGLVKSGDVIIGADSHTCTYGALNAFSTGVGSTDMAAGMATGRAWFKVPAALKFNLTGKLPENTSGKDVILRIIGDIGVDGALYKSMEFGGDGVKNLSIDDRFCIANMAIEAGGKNGIFPFDDITKEYLADKNVGEYTTYSADSDDDYEKVFNYDLSQIKPVVAFPHLPENVKDFDEIKKLDKIKIDQVVIGSCTNGRLSDFRIAAKVLKGKKVAKHTRVMVIPATQKIWLECVKEGLAEIFVNAGCVFSTPTCGPCLGGHMGILAKGERAVATTNRNFVGRMGDPESEVYLSNPYIAATVAIAGYITDTVVD